jgi:hypothetical protein
MPKEQKKKKQRYQSFQEFQEKFYPVASQKTLTEVDDPEEFGINLAKRSLRKLKLSLSKLD